jgi:transcriptional regulator of acetoin/glycerol metabolism
VRSLCSSTRRAIPPSRLPKTGNKTLASRVLGIGRGTLYKKLE